MSVALRAVETNWKLTVDSYVASSSCVAEHTVAKTLDSLERILRKDQYDALEPLLK